MLEGVSVKLSRDELSQLIVKKLSEKIPDSARTLGFDNTKCYVNYSDEEKQKINSYTDIIKISLLPGEFAFVFKDANEEFFLLVSDRPGWSINNGCEDFEKVESSLAELWILACNEELCLKQDVPGDEIYNSLLAYEDRSYQGHVFNDVVDFFTPFSLYRICDELYKDSDPYRLYSYFLLEY